MAARQGWARHKADAPLTDMLRWRSNPSSWAIIQAVQQTAAAEAEQPDLSPCSGEGSWCQKHQLNPL